MFCHANGVLHFYQTAPQHSRPACGYGGSSSFRLKHPVNLAFGLQPVCLAAPIKAVHLGDEISGFGDHALAFLRVDFGIIHLLCIMIALAKIYSDKQPLEMFKQGFEQPLSDGIPFC